MPIDCLLLSLRPDIRSLAAVICGPAMRISVEVLDDTSALIDLWRPGVKALIVEACLPRQTGWDFAFAMSGLARDWERPPAIFVVNDTYDAELFERLAQGNITLLWRPFDPQRIVTQIGTRLRLLKV